MGKVWNKFAIEVHKPEESMDTLNRSRGFPFLNGKKFDGVHFDLSLANNHAKEFYARYIEGAFRKFEGQSMFTKMKYIEHIKCVHGGVPGHLGCECPSHSCRFSASAQ